MGGWVGWGFLVCGRRPRHKTPNDESSPERPAPANLGPVAAIALQLSSELGPIRFALRGERLDGIDMYVFLLLSS